MIGPHALNCAYRAGGPCDCVFGRGEAMDEIRRLLRIDDGATCEQRPPEPSTRETEPGYRPPWARPL